MDAFEKLAAEVPPAGIECQPHGVTSELLSKERALLKQPPNDPTAALRGHEPLHVFVFLLALELRLQATLLLFSSNLSYVRRVLRSHVVTPPASALALP